MTKVTLTTSKFPVAMLRFVFVFLLFTPCYPRDDYVLQLTDINFSKVSKTKNLVVMFFIPWSGLCQKFRPHYARAALFINANNISVSVGKMDCSGLGRKTCEEKQLGLNLPAIHFYQKGEVMKEYKGSRDTLSLIKFMRAQVVPAAVELKSVQEFKIFLKNQVDVVVVGFFEGPSELQKMFFRVAEEWKENIIFAFTQCEKLLMKEGVLNGIVLFRPDKIFNRYEEERVLFTGRVIIGEIKNFITNNYYGLVIHRTPTNKQNFFNPIIVLYYTSHHQGEGKEVTYWKNRMAKVAHKYKKFVKFALSAKEDFEEELLDYVVDYTTPLRPFVLACDLENKKYVMADNFTAESFDKFVNDFLNNRLIPFFKPEPIRYENDGGVIIAVASNFDAIVINNDKDVFLDLFSPWSPRSKMFAPLLRSVADLLQGEDILVVKMDTTENKIPPLFTGRVFPSAYFLGKNRKTKPIWYQGGISVEEVIRFVAKLSTNPLVHYDRRGKPKEIDDEL